MRCVSGLSLIIAALAPLLLAACGEGSAPSLSDATPSSGELPPLRAPPLRLSDAFGREVLLRGFNLPALRSERTRPPYRVAGSVTPDAELFALHDLEDEDFDRIASSGLNAVRLRLAWEFAQPDPPPAPYNEAYFRLVDAALRKATERGLYVILDFDQFGWSRALGGNSGAPDWTTAAACAGLPESPAGAPPQLSPAVLCQWTAFWGGTLVAGAPLRQHYSALWQFMARRYRDVNGVALFDLLNEPVGGAWPPGLFEISVLFPYYRQLAADIRVIDPGRVIGFQPQVYHSAGVPTPTLEPISMDDALYMPHQYTLAYGPQRLNPAWLPLYGPLTAAHVQLARQDAERLGTAQAWGEVGWSRTASADGVGGAVEAVDYEAPVQFARAFTAAADDAKLSWIWANYAADNLTYGVNFGDVIDAPLMRELAQPFPRATAGNVLAFAYDDGARVYSQRTTDRTALPSEIGLSLIWQYPDGVCLYGDEDLLGGLDAQGGWQAGSSSLLRFDRRRQVLQIEAIPERLRIEPGQQACPKTSAITPFEDSE